MKKLSKKRKIKERQKQSKYNKLIKIKIELNI